MRSSAALPLALCLISGCYTGSTPTPTPPTPPKPVAKSGTVTVHCRFTDGWVAALPRAMFDKKQEFTMQALIGFAEDPAFWGTVEEFQRLRPYAAKPCTDAAAVFENVGPDWILLVGKANTFDQTNGYGINGAIRDIHGATEISLAAGDLNMSWPCISCPRLYAWTGTAWDLRGEVLIDVIGAGAETTQRRPIGKVRVAKGEVRLRLAEEEDEVSHVDALVLEIRGQRVAPAGPLASRDGVRATLKRGDALELRYAVNLPDGDYDATVAATGYYIPLAKLH